MTRPHLSNPSVCGLAPASSARTMRAASCGDCRCASCRRGAAVARKAQRLAQLLERGRRKWFGAGHVAPRRAKRRAGCPERCRRRGAPRARSRECRRSWCSASQTLQLRLLAPRSPRCRLAARDVASTACANSSSSLRLVRGANVSVCTPASASSSARFRNSPRGSSSTCADAASGREER